MPANLTSQQSMAGHQSALNSTTNPSITTISSNPTANSTNAASSTTTTTTIAASSIPSQIPGTTTTSINRMSATSASTTKPTTGAHQRVVTSGGITLTGASTVKIKKADTGRGTIDFPKSASTDKSRIESFLNRNLANNSSTIQETEPIRTSHSYRTKAEMLQQPSGNAHIPLHHQQSAAAATVGAASLLTSSLNSPSSSSTIKSHSAAPIKPNDALTASTTSASTTGQKSDLRPRFVAFFFLF